MYYNSNDSNQDNVTHFLWILLIAFQLKLFFFLKDKDTEDFRVQSTVRI